MASQKKMNGPKLCHANVKKVEMTDQSTTLTLTRHKTSAAHRDDDKIERTASNEMISFLFDGSESEDVDDGVSNLNDGRSNLNDGGVSNRNEDGVSNLNDGAHGDSNLDDDGSNLDDGGVSNRNDDGDSNHNDGRNDLDDGVNNRNDDGVSNLDDGVSNRNDDGVSILDDGIDDSEPTTPSVGGDQLPIDSSQPFATPLTSSTGTVTDTTAESSQESVMLIPDTPDDVGPGDDDNSDEIVVTHDDFAIRRIKSTTVHFRLRRTVPTMWRHKATCYTTMRAFTAIDDARRLATAGVKWKIDEYTFMVLAVACLGYAKEPSRSAKVVDTRATEIIVRDVKYGTSPIKFSQMAKVCTPTKPHTYTMITLSHNRTSTSHTHDRLPQ